MAKVRYIGPEPVTVPELFDHQRYVEPDEVVTVPDDRFAGYVCQPSTWEAVEEPAGWNTEPAVKPQASGAAPPATALGPGQGLRKSAEKKTTAAAAKSEPQKEEG